MQLSFFNSPFTREHNLLEQSPRRIYTVTGFGIGGLSRDWVGRIPALQIGPHILQQPVISLSTDTTGIGASRNFDGIIGADILHRFTVIFDYSRQELILEKNDRFDEPFDYDMSGIAFIIKDDDHQSREIIHVAEDSPAQHAGLRPGDLILEVDGRSASAVNMDQLKALLKHPGRTLTLKILRDGKTLLVKIALKQLV